MIPCNTFVRSVAFAALAALLWLPWAIVAAPIVGAWQARALYLIAITALYTAALSPQRARTVPIALLVAVLGSAAAILVRTTPELAIALAALLGFARSGVLHRSAPARAIAIETMLLGGGLLFARFLGGFSLLSTATAIWGFLLVQSTFFLIGGVRLRPLAEGTDPFEEAHRRAMGLLDRTGL